MGSPIQSGTFQRILATISELSAGYKLAIAVSLAGIVHLSIFQPKKQNIFPVWATFEIALTSLIVSRGGVSRRILYVTWGVTGCLLNVSGD